MCGKGKRDKGSGIYEFTMNPIFLCAFARGNLHTPAPLCGGGLTANPFIPMKSFPAQRRKDAKFFQNQEIPVCCQNGIWMIAISLSANLVPFMG